MSKLDHADLLSLGKELGYLLHDKGLCRGFSAMLCQAWLINDSETFFNRLNLIGKYKSNFKHLKEAIDKARFRAKGKRLDVLDEKTKMLLEIPALYEGIELYLSPEVHRDLFENRAIYQGNIDTIYSYARPKQLEQANLSIVLNKSYAFDGNDFINYFEHLKTVLELMGNQASIILSSSDHAVCLRYNAQNKLWEYVDINDFERFPKDKFYSRQLDSYSLVVRIFDSLGFKKYAVLNTTVMTTSSQHNALKSEWNKFNKKYPIMPQHTTIYNNKQEGLLFTACLNGHSKVVRELLKHKHIWVNQPSDNGATPLFMACQNGHLEIVRELLKHKEIQINRAKSNGITPLFMACQQGHSKVVRELLKDKHIRVNDANFDGATPLYIACQEGHLETVRELLKHKEIQVNQARKDGVTPLFMACQQGHSKVVRELLKDKHILVNDANSDGATPLFIACQNGHLETVRELLKHKEIQVNQARKDGVTPLFMACQKGYLEIACELLKHKEIQVNRAKNDGTTPLAIAQQFKHSKIVQFLKNHTKENDPRFTALTDSAQYVELGAEQAQRHNIKYNQTPNHVGQHRELPQCGTNFRRVNRDNPHEKPSKTPSCWSWIFKRRCNDSLS